MVPSYVDITATFTALALFQNRPTLRYTRHAWWWGFDQCADGAVIFGSPAQVERWLMDAAMYRTLQQPAKEEHP